MKEADIRKFFDTPEARRTREKIRADVRHANEEAGPGLVSLMNQVSSLFRERALEEKFNGDDVEQIFNECIDKIPGAREAFEIWDIGFGTKATDKNGAEPDRK